MNRTKTATLLRHLVYAAVCLALCMLLPFLTGQIPQIGSALSPMHIPVLLAGFLCGPWWAMAVGFVAPMLRHVWLGMPPLITAIAMSFELAAYGLFSGLLYRLLPKKTVNIYVSLIGAMILGRIVWGITMVVISGVSGSAFTWSAFIAGALLNAVPGIILHIVLIPILVMALKRAKVAPENVDELMFGCILTAGLGQNVARQVSVKAGIPYSVPAYTIGMVCGSGMKSVIEAGRAILAGDADIIVCGGTENMSAAPYAAPDARWGARMGDKKLVDTMIKDGLWDAFNNYHMGTTAENICDVWGITREELDAFGAASQQKTEAAQAAGRFDDEIVPVPVKVKKEIVEFKRDEYPKENVTADSIAKLRGAFPVGPESPNPQVVNTFEPTGIQDAEDKGTPRVTAANASGINDGAAAIVLASGEAVEKYGLKPMVKLIGWGQGGVDPKIMGVGPVVASRAAMAKAGVKIEDIDLVEANEAFAAQSIAVARELHFDMSKVNVNGGAISLGHPVGASGARIIVTLLHEMQKRPEAKRGLATLCIGGGMGVATIYEKC